MKIFALFLCLALNSASGHTFDKSVLENIGVYGDVPKSGYIALGKRESVTIREALEAAGFDIAQLKTTKQPYPFAIEFAYIADRESESKLLLASEDNLARSLAITVNKGASIGVKDFEKRILHLEKLGESIDSDWDANPGQAYSRLQQILTLESEISLWKDPGCQVQGDDLKKKITSRLNAKSYAALKKEIARQILELENSHARAF